MTIFNKNGEEATGRIHGIRPEKVTVTISSVRKDTLDFPIIILACAIPKRSKFEWIIEKAVELGADEIIPLKTKRTEIELKGDPLERKITRYQEVAVNAAKQSRRPRVPVIHPVTDFTSVMELFHSGTTVFIPSLAGERKNILEVFKSIPSPSRIAFLVGPEGDFTPREYAFARTHGCIGVSLGKPVLNVETAALAAVACAQLWFRQ